VVLDKVAGCDVLELVVVDELLLLVSGVVGGLLFCGKKFGGGC
jgi:hypothetical protein